jgi:putative phosphotransacetylase
VNEDQLVRMIADEVVRKLKEQSAPRAIPMAISARHIHLSPADLERLFGKGYELKVMKPLGQPGQFAAQETVSVYGPKGSFPTVRILGPVRGDTQLEVSATDARAMGIPAVFRFSGHIEGTPGFTIEGPKGRITVERGAIIAKRHIHMHPADAAAFGVQNKQLVKVRTQGERAVVFDQVLVRVSESFKLEMHIDTDEGNAAAVQDGDSGELEV